MLRALRKEEKYEHDIFLIQEKIKELHNEMAQRNLDMESNIAKIGLMDS